MLDMDIFMKFAPASVATAFASIVLPVPGGPKSSIPLQGYKKSILQYPVLQKSIVKTYMKKNPPNNKNIVNQTLVSCPLQNNSGL